MPDAPDDAVSIVGTRKISADSAKVLAVRVSEIGNEIAQLDKQAIVHEDALTAINAKRDALNLERKNIVSDIDAKQQ